ncbi:hypothetical protein [Vibrio sp. 10N.261.51.F12]|uniref:hypothetical protein n=1 Tax=Vibrio sp. 10N.261.51.F12 TaxID=3229679 RepID=UPI0035526B7A
MQQDEFEKLVKSLCEFNALPDALNALKASDDTDVAEAAESLTGQFALADVDGAQRIYHVSVRTNDAGEDEEYVEHIMNDGDDVIKFVAWFFDALFDVKQSDTYKAAGKTYMQPKRA